MLMDRRKFLQSAGMVATGLVVAPELLAQKISPGAIVPGAVSTDGRAGNVSAGVEDHISVRGYVKESTPTAGQADTPPA